MGWAKEHLSAPEREAIARELFEVTSDKTQPWLHGLCPIHGEKNSSFGYNIEEDFYNCFSCGAGGDLVSLYCAVNHLDKSEGFKKFRELYGSGTDTVTFHKSDKKKERKFPIIPESIWEQMQPLPAEWINRLQEIRGWPPEIIKNLEKTIIPELKSINETRNFTSSLNSPIFRYVAPRRLKAILKNSSVFPLFRTTLHGMWTVPGNQQDAMVFPTC